MKKPHWIRNKISFDEEHIKTKEILSGLNVRTVCREAACPNRCECWEKGHVTFMILGGICTRKCLFCNIEGGLPVRPDAEEPQRIARAAEKLGSEYVVITSVTRDDLSDKGAGHFLKTMKAIKKQVPDVFVELLIPDLGAEKSLIEEVASSGARVIGHNIEMPRSIYSDIRPKSDYEISLKTLKILHGFKQNTQNFKTKSSIIVGLGENEKDIISTLKDLKEAGVDIVHIGQYLRPSPAHWPVKRYYAPRDFQFLRIQAGNLGFSQVQSAPMVRSSYRARETATLSVKR